MIKKKNILFTACMIGAFMGICAMLPANVKASETDSPVILNAETQTASENCQLLGIRGSYRTNKQKALDRINEIRKEACKEGVADPDTGKKLTMSDYVPIKWSSGLEYMARIRAAESSLTEFHLRTNGDDCFDFNTPDGITSWAENLAWSADDGMMDGIEEWYLEKKYYVKGSGGVTGHYESLIDPDHTYIGIGSFCSDDTAWPNTTCAEFYNKKYGAMMDGGNVDYDETFMAAESDCIQVLNVSESCLTGSLAISGTETLKNNASASLSATVNYKNPLSLYAMTPKLYVMNPEFTVSDTSIAEVTAKNSFETVLTQKKCGQFTLTCTGAGKKCTKTVSGGHNYGQWTVTKEATCSEPGIKTRKCSDCGEEETASVAATGKHTYENWKTTKSATVFSTGTSTGTCSVCGKQTTKTISKLKATIKLSKTSLTLKTKKTYTMKVSYAKGDSVKSWKSGNTKIATVTAKGKITAKKKGKTTVTVTLKSGKKATVKVTVK